MNARERSRIETRRRLIEKGTELFAENGVAETRALDIAQAAGVAVGTLYLHFKDKYDLLRAILFEGIEELLAAVRELTENPPPTLEKFVHRHCEIMVHFVEEHQQLCRVLFDPESIRTNVSTEIQEYLVEMLEQRLRDRMDRGYEVHETVPLVEAHAVVGMLIHVLDWWVRHPGQVSRGTLVEILTRLRLSGWHRPGGLHESEPMQ